MSKNFELLLQIGTDEELFGTVDESNEDERILETEPSLEVSTEPRDRILRNSSLPDVFQTVDEREFPELPECSELDTELSEGSALRNLQREDPPSESQSNPSTFEAQQSIGERRQAGKHHSFQHEVKNASLETSSQLEEGEPSPAEAKRREFFTHPNRGVQFGASFRKAPSFQWLAGLRSAANAWAHRLQVRNCQQAADLTTIAHEEEIKLIERVFPGTDQDSPRVVLFGGVEDETQSAQICARAGHILAARAEGPVCVVEANFLSPALHKSFGLENVKGLATAVHEPGSIRNFAQQLPGLDLWLLPSGEASEDLDSPAMAEALRARLSELRATFRYVVIRSGPLRLEKSAMLLGRWADGVVIMVEANATRKDSVWRVKENLAAAKVKVLGVVLNNRTFPVPGSIYRRF